MGSASEVECPFHHSAPGESVTVPSSGEGDNFTSVLLVIQVDARDHPGRDQGSGHQRAPE